MREPDFEVVLEEIDDLLKLIERVRSTRDDTNADDFIGDVEVDAEDMRKRIDENDRATIGQARTVGNWTKAVEKWLPSAF